ncbi:equilibrative nucleoside transporter 2-like [Girardinichthys multiradiatus]|uniref:equilibrative nucleoside transporter 2-like n=1 Tax=Girardinichthys multiradiatus TaxID=208333 RepID=UPI001FAB5DC3|nr:equilibrative nucleoside transporter 2-like [Girardinichthys multiradiatus]XP_047220340.1 equilibrative nucleoside transporter 2-like [Girardinichthys multiradiatus]XP_047220341.1 equilibrative nucleoside transporter 2-like [Girardinichthys multiradiatus]XP_047220342.1 equilibrative nucleoside transporter 2-like [Girardinichthys multiradiatus]
MWNEKKQNPPSDRGQIVAIIIFVLGIGTLLPWNFFITASQYFNNRLKGSLSSNGTTEAVQKDYNYDSLMVLLPHLPQLLFTLLNSFLYQWVKERLRVVFSLVVIFLLFALTAALVLVPMQPDTFFSVTMATIWFINVFAAVLQGSLFGVVGMFPPRYSTVFMSGQGLAGIFAAVAMLCSKLRNGDTESTALGYFVTPCVATLGTLLCYLLLPHLEFARYYLNRNQADKLDTSNKLLSSTDKIALNGNMKDLEAKGVPEESNERSSVFAVFKKIWLMALCVTLVFAVTLSVFPVITVRVKTVYTKNTQWDIVFNCVCCFIVFNLMDLVGRSAPSLFQWPSKQSRLFPVAVLSRLVFLPLLMMCNIQDSQLTVLFRHDGAFVVIMALFSFSNGYLASLCMAYAPQLVRSRDCETAGSLMTFFLVLGLAVGASFSFLLGKLV